eukprot:CAMPEP_0182857712 /NCGR_PEP_ID=MMETSP0034_2-20130328/3212_1 /TAXON_ID=156128 /ORGANISM="Nephroselmis pyriformis, Strain CCMP717" /LENGTH=243 /DNA_ID=CAMNT_0024988977 /DNA_START=428 /DNA_END=1155 /DNA_ORIENTATION=-
MHRHPPVECVAFPDARGDGFLAAVYLRNLGLLAVPQAVSQLGAEVGQHPLKVPRRGGDPAPRQRPRQRVDEHVLVAQGGGVVSREPRRQEVPGPLGRSQQQQPDVGVRVLVAAELRHRAGLAVGGEGHISVPHRRQHSRVHEGALHPEHIEVHPEHCVPLVQHVLDQLHLPPPDPVPRPGVLGELLCGEVHLLRGSGLVVQQAQVVRLEAHGERGLVPHEHHHVGEEWRRGGAGAGHEVYPEG